MKIIHTSDLHLSSPLTSRLERAKSRERRRELRETFIRMVENAMCSGVSAFIIAGDLFDMDKITAAELDSFFSIIRRAESIYFFYLPGNHEGDTVASAPELPRNLLCFGRGFSEYKIGDVSLIGRSDTCAGMFEELRLSPDRKNIVILHGELRDRSDKNGIIGLKDAQNKSINYIALGHYHSYSAEEFEPGHFAVYSGAPEGRGFDELGSMGYVLIDTDNELSFSFIPFAKREILEIKVDITGTFNSFDVETRIREAIDNIDGKNLVRAHIVGARVPELKYDITYLSDVFKRNFYYFDIKDTSTLALNSEDYKYDKSLKGEFIRLCRAYGATDEVRDKIISCGLAALAGEIPE